MKRFAAAICGLTFTEWALFELLRAPYRPPQDMTTYLGTEKYGVITFMLGVAVCGLGLISWWAACSTWTKRNLTVIGFLIAVLTGAGIYVFVWPSWPVTPMNWILR
jgi:hypothetical protein